MTKNCVICNTSFEAKRADAEVCSNSCRVKNWRRKSEEQKQMGQGLAKPTANKKSLEYEIPNHDKNWTAELMEENARLKKENDELRPDAMSWRNRMAQTTKELKQQGEVKVTTYPPAQESNYSINTHPSKFMEEQRKKKLGF